MNFDPQDTRDVVPGQKGRPFFSGNLGGTSNFIRTIQQENPTAPWISTKGMVTRAGQPCFHEQVQAY